jgi:hypothetical protein
VRPDPDDPTVVQDDDLISLGYRRNTLRDNDYRGTK